MRVTESAIRLTRDKLTHLGASLNRAQLVSSSAETAASERKKRIKYFVIINAVRFIFFQNYPVFIFFSILSSVVESFKDVNQLTIVKVNYRIS
jgi:hypothetical protein